MMPADASQSVNVSALNDAHVFAFGGGIATGIVGIGGGINVGMIRNNVTAHIGDNTTVGARGSVDVNALGNKDIETIAISAAAGGAAIAGSVTVWSIGDAVSSSYTVQQRDDSGNQQADKKSDALKGEDDQFKQFDPNADISGDTFQVNNHGYESGDRVVYHSTDLAGHPLDSVVAETLREARERTRRLRLFGSYPAARLLG